MDNPETELPDGIALWRRFRAESQRRSQLFDHYLNEKVMRRFPDIREQYHFQLQNGKLRDNDPVMSYAKTMLEWHERGMRMKYHPPPVTRRDPHVKLRDKNQTRPRFLRDVAEGYPPDEQHLLTASMFPELAIANDDSNSNKPPPPTTSVSGSYSSRPRRKTTQPRRNSTTSTLPPVEGLTSSGRRVAFKEPSQGSGPMHLEASIPEKRSSLSLACTSGSTPGVSRSMPGRTTTDYTNVPTLPDGGWMVNKHARSFEPLTMDGVIAQFDCRVIPIPGSGSFRQGAPRKWIPSEYLPPEPLKASPIEGTREEMTGEIAE